MSVYVDDLFRTLPTRQWPFKQACHLTADTEEELHEFAKSIGLKRAWFQKNLSLDHYDITAGMRARAIRNGATPITRSEVFNMIQARRKSNTTSSKCGRERRDKPEST